jgi:hypothetical protein
MNQDSEELMQSLQLRCSLQRCNLDSSAEMNIDKCILTNVSPCYYLMIKASDEGRPEDAWKRFDQFVARKTNKAE